MADSNDKLPRHILPIPDAKHVGLTTYDAKDPNTKYPPIVPLRPPAGAPNVLIVLLDDVGFGASSAFGGPVPHAERRTARGQRAEVQPLPHDRAVLADAPGACSPVETTTRSAWARSPRWRPRRRATTASGRRTRRRCRDPEAQRLFDRAVRQVPRGAVVGGLPRGAVPPMADRLGLRVLLRLRRRRGEPVLSRPLRGHVRRRAAEDARGGLHAHRGPRRPRHHLGAPAEGADARQAVLHVLRAGRHPRAASRARRSGRTSTRASSTVAGTSCARRSLARQKKLGVIPKDAELTARHAEIPAWDDMPANLKPVLARQMEIYAGFLEQADHHVGPRGRYAIRPRGPRRHADLLHHRRQRRVGRGHAQRLLQRDDDAERHAGHRDAPSSCCPRSTISARPRPTTTTRSAGRTRCARRISGPSRSPRTGAARATARSCTGRTA